MYTFLVSNLCRLLFILFFHSTFGFDGKGNHHFDHHHNHHHFSASNCSLEEAIIISRYFKELNFDSSNCPTDPWLIDFQDIDPSIDKVFINVGFNKGYNYAQWINIWAPWTQITANSWYRGLVNSNPLISAETFCGMCNDCKSPDSTARNKNVTGGGTLYAVGVDLNKHNVKMVENAIVNFTLKSSEFGSVIIHNVFGAAANTSGRMWISDCGAGAWEGCSLVMSKESETIQATAKTHLEAGRTYGTKYTVVSLVQELQEAGILPVVRRQRSIHLRHIKSYVDMLLIDTEGFDPLVLKGASSMFRNQDVRVVIFEYHGYCPWPLFKLEEIVNLFDTFHYDCFITGRTHLWRLQRSCFHPVYDSHYWGNVMCVLRSDPWRGPIDKYVATFEIAKKNIKNNSLDISQNNQDAATKCPAEFL